MSNKFASRMSLTGEWASELEISRKPSKDDSRQFMAGSEERPVSIAGTRGVSSSKHSSRLSKPDLAPNTEK